MHSKSWSGGIIVSAGVLSFSAFIDQRVTISLLIVRWTLSTSENHMHTHFGNTLWDVSTMIDKYPSDLGG